MLGPFATASRFTLPFTRCRYCRTPPLSHAACASMSTTTTTTTTTTTRDRGDRYGPMEWAQQLLRYLGARCDWRFKSYLGVPDARRQHDQLVEKLVDAVDDVLNADSTIRHFTEHLHRHHTVKMSVSTHEIKYFANRRLGVMSSVCI